MDKYKVTLPYRTVFGISVDKEIYRVPEINYIKREIQEQARHKLGQIALDKAEVIRSENVCTFSEQYEYNLFILDADEMKEIIVKLESRIRKDERAKCTTIEPHFAELIEKKVDLEVVASELNQQRRKLIFIGLPVFTLIGGVIGYVL